MRDGCVLEDSHYSVQSARRLGARRGPRVLRSSRFGEKNAREISKDLARPVFQLFFFFVGEGAGAGLLRAGSQTRGKGGGTHSLRRCSSMQVAQKRWRHGDTTLTFFSVPQHTAHRVSCLTASSFISLFVLVLLLFFSSLFYPTVSVCAWEKGAVRLRLVLSALRVRESRSQ